MDRQLADALARQTGTPDDEGGAASVHALAEALPHIVWMSTVDGRVEYLNERALRYTGRTLEEMAGLGWVESVHPDERALTMDAMAAAGSTGAMYEAEYRLRRRDGEYRWHIGRALPVLDPDGLVVKWLGTATDIEDRKRAQQELEETTARLEQLVRCAPIGICFLDRELRYAEVNEALAEMHGLPPEEHLGRTIQEVVPGLADETLGDLRRVLASGEPVLDREITGMTPASSGERRTWLISYFPVPGKGGVARGVGAVVLDITARRRLEARFLQTQKLEAVGRLSSAVAHDFNNLLTAIGGFAHLALRRSERGGDPTQEILEVVAAAERSALLVRQLLSFTTAEREEASAVDVNAELRELQRLLRVILGDAGRLELRPAPGLPAAIANPGALEQIVVNLATNAREAMPDGGTLTLSTSVVELDAQGAEERAVEPGRYVVLTVADEGVGMDEATRSQALQPFFTTKERSQGSGLGLSTVYGLVRRFGGGVELTSRPGGGTAVAVYLPVAAAPPPRADERTAAAIARGSETILVAEDVEAVRRYLVEALSDAGYRVLAVASGEEALEVARTEAIDLLLSDVVMPGLSGPELADRLEGAQPGLPVLLMSGYADQDVGRRAFLLKPFNAVHLTHRIRDLLDRG